MSKSGTAHDYAPLSRCEWDIAESESEASLPAQRPSRRKSPSNFVCLIIALLALCFALGILSRRTFSHLRSCKNPTVRREWRSLSKSEQHDYLQAVQCLRNVPSRLGLNQTLYDDFSYVHTRTGDDAHDTAAFLSWHRWFLHIYEGALQQQCGYNGHLTYWDWSLDWENITLAPVWGHRCGFGGNGNNTTDNSGFRGFCVTDGPFARFTIPFIGTMVMPHCLSRGFLSGETLTEYSQRLRPSALEDVLRISKYEKFNDVLETGPHLSLPHIIRGDFSVPTASQDPIFYLHHTQLDRLWWKWQQRDLTRRLTDYSGRTVSNSTQKTAKLGDILSYGNLGPSIEVSEIMDTEAGPLCYRYH